MVLNSDPPIVGSRLREIAARRVPDDAGEPLLKGPRSSVFGETENLARVAGRTWSGWWRLSDTDWLVDSGDRKVLLFRPEDEPGLDKWTERLRGILLTAEINISAAMRSAKGLREDYLRGELPRECYRVGKGWPFLLDGIGSGFVDAWPSGDLEIDLIPAHERMFRPLFAALMRL